MNDVTNQYKNLPEDIAAINKSGFVAWSDENDLSSEFIQQFDDERIPVLGLRQVQIWGLQVDDERELPGHERTSIAGEELWEIILEAKDGSRYNVNSKFIVPAP